MSDYNQDQLISNMNTWLELKGRQPLTQAGFCNGISAYWLLMDLYGRDDLKTFEELKSLAGKTSGEDLAKYESYPLGTPERATYLKILKFYERILFLQGENKLFAGDTQNDIVPKANFMENSEQFNSNFNFSSLVKMQQIGDLLKDIVSPGGHYMLTSNRHAMAFFEQDGKYIFRDPNDGSNIIAKNTAELAELYCKHSLCPDDGELIPISVTSIHLTNQLAPKVPDVKELYVKYTPDRSVCTESCSGIVMAMLAKNDVAIEYFATPENLTRKTNIELFGMTIGKVSVLFVACKLLDLERIKKLIALGMDVQPEQGDNLLSSAIAIGNLEVCNYAIEELKQNIHAPSSDGYYPLVLASILGHTEIIDKLLPLGAEHHLFALYQAVCSNKTDEIKVLLKSNLDNTQTPSAGPSLMSIALANDNQEVAKLLLQAGFIAPDAKILLQNGCDVEELISKAKGCGSLSVALADKLVDKAKGFYLKIDEDNSDYVKMKELLQKLISSGTAKEPVACFFQGILNSFMEEMFWGEDDDIYIELMNELIKVNKEYGNINLDTILYNISSTEQMQLQDNFIKVANFLSLAVIEKKEKLTQLLLKNGCSPDIFTTNVSPESEYYQFLQRMLSLLDKQELLGPTLKTMLHSGGVEPQTTASPSTEPLVKQPKPKL